MTHTGERFKVKVVLVSKFTFTLIDLNRQFVFCDEKHESPDNLCNFK